jgi:hypothetical protein
VLKDIVVEAVEQNTRHRSPHHYSYTEMGFTRQQLNTAYTEIFTRFGFDPAELPHPTTAAQAAEDDRRRAPDSTSNQVVGFSGAGES